MKRALVVVAALCGVLLASCAHAGNGTPSNTGSAETLTLAVFGDWPYGSDLFAVAPLLIDSINSDPKVRLVLHVGDIHSGSQPCSGAGLVPPPMTSVPGYNQAVFDLFAQFKDPFVYTPGDNEWTDCHKSKELKSGAPLNELAAVRDLFFPNPGSTLGGRKKQVLSQAQVFDPANATDAQFVENVMWEESQVVFVTLNVPGSNNDGLRWSAQRHRPDPQHPGRGEPHAHHRPGRNEQAARVAAAHLRSAVGAGLQLGERRLLRRHDLSTVGPGRRRRRPRDLR